MDQAQYAWWTFLQRTCLKNGTACILTKTGILNPPLQESAGQAVSTRHEQPETQPRLRSTPPVIHKGWNNRHSKRAKHIIRTGAANTKLICGEQLEATRAQKKHPCTESPKTLSDCTGISSAKDLFFHSEHRQTADSCQETLKPQEKTIALIRYF